MATTISISEMTTQATATATDLFEVAVADGNSASGYSTKKMSADVIANGMLNTYTYPVAMPDMQNRTIIGAINTLLANFASVYDSTATYTVDDVVTYNGVLYKCTTAVTTAEAFDNSKWIAINVVDINAEEYNFSTTEHIVGTWVDGKPLYAKTYVKTGLTRATTSTIVVDASELPSNAEIVSVDAIYQQDNKANSWKGNVYINSNSIMNTWLAGGHIYRWSEWGNSGPDTMTGVIKITYTKSTD